MKNTYVIEGSKVYISAVYKDIIKREIIIDVEDLELVSSISGTWHVEPKKQTWYAYTKPGSKRIMMHRLIMNCTDSSIFIDHMNHNGLVNTRDNLRYTSPAGNNTNHSSSYSGEPFIHWDKDRDAYRVRVRGTHVGSSIHIEDAINMRDKYLSDNGMGQIIQHHSGYKMLIHREPIIL